MDLNMLTIFIKKHLLLSVSFLMVLVTLILQEFVSKTRQAPTLSAQDLVLLMNDEEPMIFEIKDPEIFKNAHIVGAKNINPKDLDPKKFEAYKKNKLIFVCEQGIHSKTLANKLKSLGWEDVSSLQDGLRSWREAGLPLVKK